MREIKFRGQMSHGAWVYGDLLYHSNCGSASIAPDEEHCWPINPDTVGQYTGLKDADGREIYEGDVLDCKQIIAPVIYNDDGFVLDLGHVKISLWAVLHKGQKWHVIGNVIDSPELLEADHERD